MNKWINFQVFYIDGSRDIDYLMNSDKIVFIEPYKKWYRSFYQVKITCENNNVFFIGRFVTIEICRNSIDSIWDAIEEFQ